MRKTKILASLAAVAVLILSLVVLASCSQPQQSSSSKEEKLEVAEVSYTAKETEPFYVLLVGDDSRTGTTEIAKAEYADGTGRSDTIMLTRVDPSNYQISLVTIPRDTEDSIGGTPTKINERYRQGGIDDLLNAVEGLTGVRPRYYMSTTFVNFEKAVDALGGLHMYVPYNQSMKDIVSGTQIEYAAGEHDLNGAEALVFARERKKYNDLNPVGGEPLRQSNDRMIVQTIVTKVISNASTASDVARALYPFVNSNWDVDSFAAFVQDFADHASQVKFVSGTGPYDGYTNSTAGWLATRDTETWAKIIEVVNAGGDPNTVLQAPTLY